VIGINSSKIVYTGFEGIGFAIPIDEAQPIVNDLINYGYVKGRVTRHHRLQR
jgi:serine protease Do